MESRSPSLPRSAFWRQTSVDRWNLLWEVDLYHERVARLLETAERSVLLAGWQLDSRILLPGGSHPSEETLRGKLLRLCRARPELQIFLLIWDHSWVYTLEREWNQTRRWEEVHDRIHLVFDNRLPIAASHHEKFLLIDGRTALCGGIDLCDQRWDTPGHHYFDRRRSLGREKEKYGPYHDLAIEFEGEAVQWLETHWRRRWQRLCSRRIPTKKRLPARPQAHSGAPASTRVYLSRTATPLEAHPIQETRELFCFLIRATEQHLLLENQYYWSPEIHRELLERVNRSAETSGLELELILPDPLLLRGTSASLSELQLIRLHELWEIAQNRGISARIFFPLSPPHARRWPLALRSFLGRFPGFHFGLTQTEGAPKPIYVHSKLILVDDRWLSVGSANLARRALGVDTEFTLTLEARTAPEREQFRELRQQVQSHWQERFAIQDYPLNRLPPLARLLSRCGLLREGTDPSRPWFEPLRRRLRNHSPAVFRRGLTLLNLAIALVLIFVFTARSDRSLGFNGVFVPLMALWGLAPLPAFLILSIGMAILPQSDLILVAWNWGWISHYASARLFPISHRRQLRPALFRKTSPLHQNLGARRFSEFLRMLVDPHFSAHAKLFSASLWSLASSWLLLGFGVVLPSLAWGIAQGLRALIAVVAHAFAGPISSEIGRFFL